MNESNQRRKITVKVRWAGPKLTVVQLAAARTLSGIRVKVKPVQTLNALAGKWEKAQ